MASTTFLQQAYLAYFGRPADVSGLGFYADKTEPQVVAAFSASPESQAFFGSMNTLAQINAIYLNLFNRPAEPAGLTYWSGEINAGRLSLAQASMGILNGAQNADKLAVTNKLAASTAFTAALDTTDEMIGYQGTAVIASARSFLASVTSDAATLTAATSTTALSATVAATVAAGATSSAAGQTFTLTTASNLFTGDAKDNTFEGGLIDQATAANSTLTASDVLVGGLGTDTLNIVGTGTTLDALGSASVSGIEIINVRATTANTLDASNASGATNVNASLGAGTFGVTGLAAGAAIGVIGNGTVTNGAVSFAYATASSDVTLNLVGGTKVATTVTNSDAASAVTKATINSTGAANAIGILELDGDTAANTIATLIINATTDLTATLAADDYTAAGAALTVTGAGKVDIAALGNFKTVDASTSSGGLTMTIDTVTTSFKGSTANDTITTATLAAPAAGIIDGGAGTGDKLVVAAAANVATAALRASYTNFEVLANSAGASIVASDYTGITSVESSATAGGFTGLSAAQAANIAVTATQAAVTYALTTDTGTSDVLGLTLGTGLTTAAATSVTTGALTVTGIETLNLKANAGPTSATGTDRTSTIDSITNANLSAVNLTGTAFTFGDIATSKAVAWDASALTGNGASTPVGLTLTTTGAAFAGSVVTGSGLRDSVIMTSSTGVTFNLGAGNDIFSTTSTLILPSGAATDNTINAGAGTSDQLVFTGAATLTDTSFTKTSGFESLQLAGAGVDNSVTGLGAGFLGAFADGVTVTDTATQSDAKAFTWASGLYSKAVTLTHVSSAVGSSTAANQSITTGAGDDKISLTTDAFVGADATGGTIVISTGAGADNITFVGKTAAMTVQAGQQAVTITGGAGADVIDVTTHVNQTTDATKLSGNIKFVIAAGDSTTTAYDKITGFDKGNSTNISDALTFASKAIANAGAAYSATTATGFTSAELTVAAATTGLVTFAGTKAATLTIAEKIAAVQSVVVTGAGDTVYWEHTTSGVTSTYVFNNNATADSVVELVGLSGVTTLATTNAVTNHLLFLA